MINMFYWMLPEPTERSVLLSNNTAYGYGNVIACYTQRSMAGIQLKSVGCRNDIGLPAAIRVINVNLPGKFAFWILHGSYLENKGIIEFALEKCSILYTHARKTICML